MIIRRRDQFDLSVSFELPITFDDEAAHLQMLVNDSHSVGCGEAAALLHQRAQLWIAFQPVGVCPAQVEPRNEISIISVGQRVGISHGLVALLNQLIVARVTASNVGPVHAVADIDEVRFFLFAPRAALRQRHDAIGQATGGIVKQLFGERRHHIECCMHLWVLLQHFEHMQIVFGGM